MDNHRILQEGDLVQWYRIEKVLGRGGFGVTYLATDTNLDHKVAIKEYMPGWAVERLDDNSLEPLNDEVRREFDLGVASFLREARTLVKFRHPNIVRVMAVFEANNTAYLVMEYEEGEEFKSYVQRGDGVDEQSLQSLILRIVDGLDQVHQYGFLHRDIKPVNLIIRNDGTPVLLDFGAARPTDGDAAAHTAYVSAGYTPIEQYQEGEGMEVGPWTDIYALGATLYYAISGETPIGPTGRLAALVNKSPDPLSPARRVGAGRYSESFLEAIDWALSFRPSDRPRNLTEWREAFGQVEHYTEEPQRVTYQPEPLASHGNRQSVQPGYQQNNREPRRKSSAGRWISAVVSLSLVALAGGWFYRSYQQQTALGELLQQADNEFGRGAYIDGALPLYREVISAAPDNQLANSRLAEIEQIYKKQIESAIDTGEFDLAESTLSEFKIVSADNDLVTNFEQQIKKSRDSVVIEQQFSKAAALNASGQHQGALDVLTDLRSVRPDDPRIAEIEASAQSALDQNQLLKEQQEAKLAEQREREARNKKRIADANRRQRQRRQTYNNYLRLAEEAVSDGEISTARKWLDDARALQISDERLTSLESQVVAQESFQRKPLSEYEVSYATGQFNALRGAVESKNTRAIESLSDGTPSREALFNSLFSRYTRLDAQIVDVQSAIDPKRVTARLRIEAMILPNGDIVYPSPAYRDTELTLNRQRYGWSRVIW